MISSKNDPNYVFEEYKGYTIASHKNNVVGKDIDNLIIVYRSNEFPNFGFIIGIDDSKLSGRRKSVPHNMDDAKAYVDRIVKAHQQETEKMQTPTRVPQKITERFRELAHEERNEAPKKSIPKVPEKRQRKGRKM